MPHAPTRSSLSVPALRSEIAGDVIAPGDEGYDKARAEFYGGFDRHPAIIVKAAGTADIQRVIALARETGLEIAVRSGGHSNAGHSTTEGGILLDLGGLKALDVDVAGRTAWAETGLTAVELSAALGRHGLAIGFGDTGSVGVGGITLGGGVGFLARRFGLTIDNLLAADIVTADGRVLRVDSTSHPDLFWAIRGGGGNFGVATRFHFRLHEVPSFVGGMLLLPATAETIAGFMSLSAAAPEALSTIANVMPAPPMPFLPREAVGKLVILAFMAYAGDVEAGQRVLAPFRALATPLADMLRPMAYHEIYPPEDDSYHPTAIGRTMFMNHVDRPTAQLIVDRLTTFEAPLRVVQLRALGGAVARVADDATAYAHRQSRIMVNVAAFYEGDADREIKRAWVERFSAELNQGDAGAYVNFLMDEGQARVRDAYPGPTWDRLVDVKRRYDPTNLFHLNQNIPPDTGVAR